MSPSARLHRLRRGEGAPEREVAVPVPPAPRRQVPHVAAGDDGARRLVVAGLQEQLLELAARRRGDAEVPLQVGDEREAAGAPALLLQPQPPELHRLLGVDRQRPGGAHAAVGALEGGVAEPVPAGEAVVARPTGRGRERPHLVGVAVPEVEEAPRAVLGEVLLPAHEHAELRVVDPREAAAGLRHREADARVGDDVGPRPRRARVGDDVLAAIGGEMAVAARAQAGEVETGEAALRVHLETREVPPRSRRRREAAAR